MRDLGNAGEAKVKEWCSLAGITANKAEIDRHGWDLFFEIGNRFDVTAALGLHESDYECKVQVKATDRGVVSLPIELSNLRSMATTTLPSFYLLIDYAGGDSPDSAYLLHVDNDHCEKILKRIRSESAKNKKVKLNSKTMVLSFKEAHRIEPLSGAGLKAAIVDFIGRSQSLYVANKQKFLASVGYDTGAISMKFSIQQQDLQRFVEMSLGDSSRIEVKDLKAFSTRFGIPELLPDLQSDTALVSVSPATPDENGRVVFRNRRTGSRSEFEVAVYRAALGDWVPDEYKMVRFRANRFTIDIGFSLENFKISFHKGEDVPADIKELLKFSKLLLMLTAPGDVDMCITFNGKDLKGRLGGEGFKGHFEYAIKVYESALRTQHYFDCYDDLSVTPKEVISKSKKILDFINFLTIDDALVQAKVSFKLESYHAQITSAECIVPFSLTLGGMCFISLCVLGGELSQLDGEYCLDVKWRKPIYNTYCLASMLNESGIIAELEKRASEYETSATVIDLSEKYLQPLIKRSENSLLFGN